MCFRRGVRSIWARSSQNTCGPLVRGMKYVIIDPFCLSPGEPFAVFTGSPLSEKKTGREFEMFISMFISTFHSEKGPIFGINHFRKRFRGNCSASTSFQGEAPKTGIPVHIEPKTGSWYILKRSKKRTPRAVFLAHEKTLKLFFFAPKQQ